MKFIYTSAVVALLGQASAITLKYAEAEGPTKADYGEADDLVVPRQEPDDKDYKWKNPLGFHDDGTDDDWVVVQVAEEDVSLLQLESKKDLYGKRRIYDLDGDGVEDNVKRSRDELDRFYYPNQFGDAGDDIHNTHHGNLPGHLRLEEYEYPPKDHNLYKFQTASYFDTHFLYGGSDDPALKAAQEANAHLEV